MVFGIKQALSRSPGSQVWGRHRFLLLRESLNTFIGYFLAIYLHGLSLSRGIVTWSILHLHQLQIYTLVTESGLPRLCLFGLVQGSGGGSPSDSSRRIRWSVDAKRNLARIGRVIPARKTYSLASAVPQCWSAGIRSFVENRLDMMHANTNIYTSFPQLGGLKRFQGLGPVV